MPRTQLDGRAEPDDQSAVRICKPLYWIRCAIRALEFVHIQCNTMPTFTWAIKTTHLKILLERRHR